MKDHSTLEYVRSANLNTLNHKQLVDVYFMALELVEEAIDLKTGDLGWMHQRMSEISMYSRMADRLQNTLAEDQRPDHNKTRLFNLLKKHESGAKIMDTLYAGGSGVGGFDVAVRV